MTETPSGAPGDKRPRTGERKGAAVLTVLMAAALLAVLPSPVRAQGTWLGGTLEAVANAMRWKMGPFLANAAIVLQNAGYDSDVLYRSATTSSPDFRFAAGPDVQVMLPLKTRGAITVSASPRYVFYAETTRLRALNYSLAGTARYTFGRISLSGSARWRNSRVRLNTELPIDIRLNSNSEAGRIQWQLSRTQSLAVGVRTADYSFGDEVFEGLNVGRNLNRREDLFDVTTYFEPNSKTRFFVSGDYGLNWFKEPVSRFRDSRSYSTRAGVEFAPPLLEEFLTAGFQGVINLGYKHFELVNQPGKPFGGFVGDTTLSIGFMPRTAVRAYFGRDVQFSLFSTNAYYVQTSFGGGIMRYLTKRAALAYDVLYNMNRYPQGEPGSEGPLDRLGRYLTHFVRLDWRVQRYLSVGLVGRAGWRSTDPRLPAKYRFVIGLNMVYGAIPESSLGVAPLGF